MNISKKKKKYGNHDTSRKEHNNGRHSLGEFEVVDYEKNSFKQQSSGYYKKKDITEPVSLIKTIKTNQEII